MVKGKANRVRNSGFLSPVDATGNFTVYSIVIPKQCDEIRFQVGTRSPKNAYAYSFDDMFNVPSINGTLASNSLSVYNLNFVNGDATFLRAIWGGELGFSQEIVIRNPSDFGEAIYFVGSEIGSDEETFIVQWQIIGGCNPNGY